MYVRNGVRVGKNSCIVADEFITFVTLVCTLKALCAKRTRVQFFCLAV